MRVILEADGGSRGNPGPAAYGTILRNAETGAVIAERAESIGRETNNVAEYLGLIAGLELYRQNTPSAELEVRLDSKLVVEQMAGRWKVKHPSMRALAARAKELAPPSVVWTWVPREENAAADAILNAALDNAALDNVALNDMTVAPDSAAGNKEESVAVGWGSHQHGEPTTIILLRHGVTPNTVRKLFCGSGGSDPELTELGKEQAGRAATWLEEVGGVDAVVASPLRRTQETAGIVAHRLGLEVSLEAGMVETDFGEWDGFSFAEIMARWPVELDAWLGSTAIAPPGGETFDAVCDRVVAARDRLLRAYAGKTVVVVSHVTPIKMMVRLALDAPMRSIYKMELAPASITTVAFWPDGTPSLRNFSVVPH